MGDARAVALGEATHGTREFFRLKHRIFEFLAERMGFTVFAIEANWPESLSIDDYVVSGRGDPAAALAGLGFWTWNTQEVLDLIQWMRSYNADPRLARKLRFYGFDAQAPMRAASMIRSYLRRVEPSYEKMVDFPLERLETLGGRDRAAFYSVSVETRGAVREIEGRILQNRDRYEKRGGAQEWRLARRTSQILREATELFASPVGLRYGQRDRAMAENVRWIAEDEGPRTRLMIWAHNAHVARVGDMMGAQLARTLGSDYRTFGFAFGEGSFQARDGTLGGGQPGTLRTFSVGPPPADSVDSIFSAVHEPLFVLDLRQPAPAFVARFFSQPHETREIGAFFQTPASMLQKVSLSDRYDAVIFVEKTSAARALPIAARSSQ